MLAGLQYIVGISTLVSRLRERCHCYISPQNISYEGMIARNECGSSFLSLKSSPSCHTLSNAWLISRKTAEQNCLLSSARLIVSVIRCICYMVPWRPRNPNWWKGITSDKCVRILFNSIFAGVYYLTPTVGLWVCRSLLHAASFMSIILLQGVFLHRNRVYFVPSIGYTLPRRVVGSWK